MRHLLVEPGLVNPFSPDWRHIIPARRRELKPDSKVRYRLYHVLRLDAEGNRKEHRFNLGTDIREAERRMERLYDLHDESEAAAGETI